MNRQERAQTEREHRQFAKSVRESHATGKPTIEPRIYDPDPKTKKCRCIYCKGVK